MMLKPVSLLVAVGAIGFAVGMYVHKARADDVPATPPLPPQTQQLSVVEWRIRGMVETKERNPVGNVTYTGGRWLGAKECLAKLAKPDAELAKNLKVAEGPMQTKGFVLHWTCVPMLVLPEGKGA